MTILERMRRFAKQTVNIHPTGMTNAKPITVFVEKVEVDGYLVIFVDSVGGRHPIYPETKITIPKGF